MNDTAATDTALDALERARRAWEKRQDQQQLDLDPDAGLDETHDDTTTPSSPPGGRVRLVEPGSTGSGASPTPALTASRALPSLRGSSFRQDTNGDRAGARVPGPRHLHVAPDPTVPTPIPLPRLLEVLS